MYDSLSGDYDRFVNWDSRLAFELPFIERQLPPALPGNRGRVLDAACGTGMHAIALAKRGLSTAGADLSAGMIKVAVENARKAGVQVDFRTAGFGGLSPIFSAFDQLICMGNSLPHLLGLEEMRAALSDFADCLRPGGVLLIQNRNFDSVLRRRERWMSPESHRSTDAEWIFMRFYDFDPDGLITFNMVTLKREKASGWEQKIDITRLYPLRAEELSALFGEAGFANIRLYGGMDGSGFDPGDSGNLVAVASKSD